MKLVVLYGPPGVGKYTVGKMLADRLGFKFLHNHLIVDFATSLFPGGSPEFVSFAWKLSDLALTEAIRAEVPGVVSTLVYEKGVDDDRVIGTVRSVEAAGGTVVFVQLTCSKDELMKRVVHESRAGTNKIKSPDTLREVLRARDLTSPMAVVPSHRVDTSLLTPEETLTQVLASLESDRR